MENLNAEQIKKALECCSSSDGVSACESGCPYWGGDYDTCPCIEEPNFIIKNALALINSQEQRIKELTEREEKLIHCSECRHGQQVGDLGVVCEYGCEEYRPFDHFCGWGERRDFASDAEDE